MSGKVVGRVLQHRFPTLPSGERGKVSGGAANAVMVTLAERARDDGAGAWPSVETIADRSQLSPGHVRRVLTALREAGYIEQTAPPRHHRPATWRLRLDRLQTARDARPETARDARPKDRQGARGERQSARGDTSGRASDARRYVLNRPVEPSNTCAVREAPAARTATQRPRDPLFDAVIEVCGIDPAALTRDGHGAASRAVKQLREIGATPDEVRARGPMYRMKFNGAALTPNALAKHWAALTPDARNLPGVYGTIAGVVARKLSR